MMNSDDFAIVIYAAIFLIWLGFKALDSIAELISNGIISFIEYLLSKANFQVGTYLVDKENTERVRTREQWEEPIQIKRYKIQAVGKYNYLIEHETEKKTVPFREAHELYEIEKE